MSINVTTDGPMSNSDVPKRSKTFSHPYGEWLDDFAIVAEKVFKVDIDETVVNAFTTYADGLGMKNKAVAERLLKYFLSRPDAVRRHMLGLVDGNEAEEIKRFADSLNRSASKKAK